MLKAGSITQRDRIVAMLTGIFSQLFGIGVEDIDIHTPFLELGADSLMLLHASQAIQGKFAIKVPFRMLLADASSILSLAEFLNEKLALQAAPAAELQDQNEPVQPGCLIEPINEPAPIVEDQLAAGMSGLPEILQASPQPGKQPASLDSVPVNISRELGNLNGHSYDASMAGLVRQQLQVMALQLELLRNKKPGSSSQPAQPTRPQLTAQPPASTGGHKPAGSFATEASLAKTTEAVIRQSSENQDKQEPFVPYKQIKKGTAGLDERQQEYLNGLIARLCKRTQGSKQRAQTYRPFLADNRATAGFRLLWKEIQYPLVVERALGSRMWDVDGNEYVDITMGFGALLFGHSPAFLIDAVQEQLKKGIQLGGESHLSGQAAKLICELTGVERATFCNSGTEAVMSALRLARTVTGRTKIAMFEGTYHGTFDGIMVRGERSCDGKLSAVPVAPGIPNHMIENVLLFKYAPESVEEVRAHAHELAAVLVEPPPSRRPDVRPVAFLQGLREVTEKAGAALIFDEVVTGFRFHPGGAQALFNIRADIVTYGKAIGAGIPVAVVAGKAAYVDAIDGGAWNYGDLSYPQAETTYFAGTFFKNPLSMSAVWAVLNEINQRGIKLYEDLDDLTLRLVESLNTYFDRENFPIQVVHTGSLFRFDFSPDLKFTDLFYFQMLEKGVYICETRNCFLSTAHTDEDIDHVIRAVKETVTELRDAGFLPARPATLPPDNEPTKARPKPPANTEASAADVPASAKQAPSVAGAGNQADTDAHLLPLTEAQKELWVISQMSPDASSAYNESIILHLRGPINRAAIRKALQEVVNRHDALRITFSPHGDYQKVSPSLEVELTLVDFSPTGDSRKNYADEYMSKETSRRFDLVNGPLFRTSLVKLEDDSHFLVLAFHHLITDGWSNGILLQEMSLIYSAVSKGVAYQLPPAMQFSEYIKRIDEQQKSEMSMAEDHWLTKYADPTAVLRLPLDYARPPEKTHKGAGVQTLIDASVSRRLKSLSLQHGCTLFMTLLAGFNVLLHRLSGQSDIVVGIPAAGQLSVDGANLVGYCVNLLPLRSRMDDQLTFINYLSNVKDEILDAYDHQHYPFSRLVKKLNLPRDPSRMPLVEAAFNLDSAGSGLPFSGLEVDFVESPSIYAKFEIYLNVIEEGEGIRIDCEYNSDLFDRQTIERWMQHLSTLLEAITLEPDQRLSVLPLLTQAAQHQLIVDWAGTQAAYPQSCIHTLFEAQVDRNRDAVAVVYENQRLTYGELNNCANQLAHHLREQGVRPESLVGICMDRSPEMVVGLLAILKAGGAYVPLDSVYPIERLAFILEDSRISVLLTQENLKDKFPSFSGPVVLIDSGWPVISAQGVDNLPCEVGTENLCYVTYTSGSTGKPKGIEICHRSVIRLLFGLDDVHLSAEETFLQISPVAFDASTFELWGALLYGARCVLYPARLPTPPELRAVINNYRVTTLWLTASLFNAVVDEDVKALLGIKQLLVGGEALSVRHIRRALEALPDVRIINGYGPTESTTFTCCYPVPGQVDEALPSIPIGRPIGNTQVYILDSRLQVVPIGVAGELHIGGDGLARAYLHHSQLTAEKFIPNPFGKPGSRLYKTGDLSRYLADGQIEFLARIDDQVKIRGFRIEPGEIESTLAQHPAVKETAVIARPMTSGESRLIAYIVADQGQALTTSGVRSFLKDKLPDYMIPATFLFLDSLPLMRNGKVDRQALPLPDAERPEVDSVFMPPLTKTERLLSDIWSQALGVKKVGILDNFFELGGDSILGIQIMARARDAGIHLTIKQLFQHQTIADLTLVVSESSTIQAEQDIVVGPVPLTPIQHWFFEQDVTDPHHWNFSILLETRYALDADLLARVVRKLLSHHDALRLRFIKEGSEWHQMNAGPSEELPLTRIDLSHLNQQEQRAEIEAEATRLQRSLDLSRGPLVRVASFNLGEKKTGRLLLVLHHLMTDIISRRILIEDLQVGYRQAERGEEINLGAKTTSYKRWAERLAEYAQTDAAHSELDYWQAELSQAFGQVPVDYEEGENTEASVREVVVKLDEEQTQKLLKEVPGVYQTQINEVLLAGLAGAVRGWGGEGGIMVDMEGHGRETEEEEEEVSRTVGWFTRIYPVVMKRGGEEEMGERLKGMKEQVRGMPGGGKGYGVLRYLSQRAEAVEQMSSLPQAQISFNYLGRSGPSLSNDSLFAPAPESTGPSRSPRAKRRHLLEINGAVVNHCLHMVWAYSENVHQRSTIERLAQRFIDELRAIIAHCESSKAGGYTPSDFPMAKLDERALNKLLEKAKFKTK